MQKNSLSRQSPYLIRIDPIHAVMEPVLGSNTYRTVYTVRFAGVVYVLHAFQKKAKKGIATPLQHIELVKSRLRDAELHYRGSIENGGRKP